MLHHDGRWSHDGAPILNARLREHFDRSVRWLPDPGVHVVTLRQFRAQIEVEEAGFFVRSVDLERGRVRLSDGSEDALDVGSLRSSPIDGAWLCRVKHDLAPAGLLARLRHAAHAELADGVVAAASGAALRVAGRLLPLPPLD